MRSGARIMSWGLALALTAGPLLAQERALGPQVAHRPVGYAPRGRPLGGTATITPRGAPVKRVTLYYTPSRDMSPFKVSMLPTGDNLYLGTLPSHHTARGQVLQEVLKGMCGTHLDFNGP